MVSVVPADQLATGTLDRVAPHGTSVALFSRHYWRIHRAMLQRELAEASRVTLRTVQRLKSNNGRAGLDTVRHLAAALDVKPIRPDGSAASRLSTPSGQHPARPSRKPSRTTF